MKQPTATNPADRPMGATAIKHMCDFVIRDVTPDTMAQLDVYIDKAPYPCTVHNSHHLWVSGSEYRVTLVLGTPAQFGHLVAGLLCELASITEPEQLSADTFVVNGLASWKRNEITEWLRQQKICAVEIRLPTQRAEGETGFTIRVSPAEGVGTLEFNKLTETLLREFKL